MNREEFMAKLKALLGDIPADEREEALQYYRQKSILMRHRKAGTTSW